MQPSVLQLWSGCKEVLALKTLRNDYLNVHVTWHGQAKTGRECPHRSICVPFKNMCSSTLHHKEKHVEANLPLSLDYDISFWHGVIHNYLQMTSSCRTLTSLITCNSPLPLLILKGNSPFEISRLFGWQPTNDLAPKGGKIIFWWFEILFYLWWSSLLTFQKFSFPCPKNQKQTLILCGHLKVKCSHPWTVSPFTAIKALVIPWEGWCCLLFCFQ